MEGDAKHACRGGSLRAAAAEQIRPLLGIAQYGGPNFLRRSRQPRCGVSGASAVIHLAGILVEQPGSTYEQANVAPARSVVEAAKRCAAEKIVLVSATGADEKSSNGYYRTKGQAEALVRASGLCYTILRAPLLLGPGTEGSAALGAQRSRSKAKLIGGGRNLQQPLYVDDLARAAMAAAQASVACNRTLDLVGPVSLPERELVERAARLLGRRSPDRLDSQRIAFIRAGHSSALWRPGIFAGRSRSDHGRHATGSAAGRERTRNPADRNRRDDSRTV